MAEDDLATERARLEAVAWGADSTPAEAARARIALEDLTAGRRPRRSSAADAVGGRTGRPDAGQAVPADPRTGSVPTTAAPSDRDLSARGRHDVPGPASALDAPFDTASGTAPPAPTAAGEVASGPAEAPPSVTQADHGSDATTGDGRGAGLQAGWRRRVRDLLWTRRPRVWIALGAIAAVGVAFAAGTVVGTARPSMPAAPSITPTAGTVTLEQLLDVPQTYADQLPGPVDAPVSLHSTRLIFTNRALDGGDLETPWSVWAGVGTDRSTICLVASADRIESSTACYPREDALHGSVSLSAQSTSGTLTLWLRGGGVQGTVTDGY
ncbi:hypothetical protein ABC270_10535 [Curtobacterium sp. 1P10AnD]|uniref:hypothetical protein n=1 Tax=Curtobacterium sp. 1P10AnD TaxID=3132283 RepID=UPI0039A04ADB